MTSDNIEQAILDFRRSSRFSSDPMSFKVKFGTYELPGKYDPSEYLDQLGIKSGLGRLIIIYPGNGGLCVEAIKRGALNILAVEPREHYLKALMEVSGFSMTLLGHTFSSVSGANATESWKEVFDTVIWAEGLDRCKDPVASIKNVINLLKPGGSMFIEVVHGQHNLITPPTNAWLPKEDVFEKVLATSFNELAVEKIKGRLDRRTVYKLTKAPVVISPMPQPSEVLPEEACETDTSEAINTKENKPKKVNMKRRK